MKNVFVVTVDRDGMPETEVVGAADSFEGAVEVAKANLKEDWAGEDEEEDEEMGDVSERLNTLEFDKEDDRWLAQAANENIYYITKTELKMRRAR